MGKPTIVTDPKVCMGKPVIAGTRITVELILEKLGAGETIDDVLESYPHLTRDSILEALKYAARVLGSDTVFPVGDSAA